MYDETGCNNKKNLQNVETAEGKKCNRSLACWAWTDPNPKKLFVSLLFLSRINIWKRKHLKLETEGPEILGNLPIPIPALLLKFFFLSSYGIEWTERWMNVPLVLLKGIKAQAPPTPDNLFCTSAEVKNSSNVIGASAPNLSQWLCPSKHGPMQREVICTQT